MFQKSPFVFPLCFLLAVSLQSAAQHSKEDSLRLMRENMTLQAALRYPALRMVTVQVETIGNTHYTSRLYGKDWTSGMIHPEGTIKAAFNLPVYTSARQEISVNATYNSMTTTLTNTTNQNPQFRISNGEYTLQNLAAGLNYRRTDSLFHKPITWGGMFQMNFSLQSSFNRGTGLIFGIVPLKTTPTTRISAGVLVFIDPTATIPAVPTFFYWHKFSASAWEISADLPVHLFLRRPVFSKGLLSIGTELADHTLLRKQDGTLLQGGYAFKNLDLKNGLTLEYPIARKVLIGCSGGLLYTPTYRILDPGKSYKDYIGEIKRNPGPYFNINISLLR